MGTRRGRGGDEEGTRRGRGGDEEDEDEEEDDGGEERMEPLAGVIDDDWRAI